MLKTRIVHMVDPANGKLGVIKGKSIYGTNYFIEHNTSLLGFDKYSAAQVRLQSAGSATLRGEAAATAKAKRARAESDAECDQEELRDRKSQRRRFAETQRQSSSDSSDSQESSDSSDY
jgi:hypothetical protein